MLSHLKKRFLGDVRCAVHSKLGHEYHLLQEEKEEEEGEKKEKGRKKTQSL